ncbi:MULTISPECIES: lasso peptide biosynthesis B2 protein [Streptomyces]|uniref:lasso peptide biosynthesis B2 protein n=1 Tax=Streptomyces TaxID=1883 RepID=UPI00163C62D2|nr:MULTISPECIES: lasso peptide biosynthesis B2 protein [Streptomyces]MBC2877514.1 lasso peptide biosynthesis B2 protein [Streptomyces sp. TYQ1024]UBI36244.1 lasso peptide biosynthesis B2 protein [Streptomyces mobaraensis]UKW28838.1 lasso peptide biosynthesis B2 protein [Streptomyces sp. TYQ1024]
MSAVVPRRAPVRLSPGQRLLTLAAVALAGRLARRPPARIRAVLTRLARGARPATYAEARAARAAVEAVSLRCASDEGCLPRSLATVLLCRARGRWPAWAVGVRARPPFGAHAWVEAEGRMVEERADASYFRVLFTVPAPEGRGRRG